MKTDLEMFARHASRQLLEQADQALYYSKKNGRNQVTRHDGMNRESAEETEEVCIR